jgi:nucleoid-associated protein YgaU
VFQGVRFKILLRTEGDNLMWKTFKESFDSPDSYVSMALGLAVVLVIGMITYNYFKAKMQPGKTTEEQKQEEQAALQLPGKYTVKEGDTLWSIAETQYKSGYNWVDIAKTNNLGNADYIEAGQTLTIPDVKPILVPPGEVSSASTDTRMQPKTYTVVRGDSLWAISVRIYNNGYRWTDIASLNKLAKPDIIHAGNILTLP